MKKIFALIFITFFAIFTSVLWWNYNNNPVDKNDKTPRIFVVKPGQGVREIATNLKAQGLIKNTIVFFLITKQYGIDKKIEAGDHRVFPFMTTKDIALSLTHGTLDIWITVPEGQRAEEIGDTLKEKIPTYQEPWRKILNVNEGYLFPDTYLIPKDADINTIVSVMKNNFNAKIISIDLSPNDPQIKEITTIASLIEREALGDEEKPIISSVIANRLKAGMSLDIDATLQYIKGKDSSGKWWSIPADEDKKINSSYNTYRNAGLPPAPISNPGLEAIKAALNPRQTDYYYYIHDLGGNVHFAKTLEEHNVNIRKYIQ